MAGQLIESTEDISKTHHTLVLETTHREKLKSGIADIQELFLLVDKIKNTIQALRILHNFDVIKQN